MNKSFWKNKRVLITGHTGFKGSWLYFLLKLYGVDTYGISLKPPKKSLFNLLNKNEKNKSFFCDLKNFEKINTIIKKTKPEIIFHFAAQSLVGKSYKFYEETYLTNFIGTLNILKTVKYNKSIKTCIITTTDKVYENLEDKKIYSENDYLAGKNPYSGSKVAKEHLIFSFAKSYLNKKNIIVVRSGNVIGGDFTESRLIPDMINSFQKKKKFFVRNENHTRPWQHIYDVLKTYIKLVEKIHKMKKYYGVFNVSFHNKRQLTVKEIINIFSRDSLFKSLKIKRLKKKKYFEDSFLNISNFKINKFIKIKSKYKNIEDCIFAVIQWYKIFLLEKKNILKYSENEIKSYFKK